MPRTEVVRNFGEYRIVMCYIVVVEKSNSFNSWERQISTLLCPFLRLRAPLRPDTTTLGCQWGLGTGQNHRSAAAACSRCSSRYSSVHQSTSTRGGPGPHLRTARSSPPFFPQLGFGVADSVDTSMTGWSGPLPHPSRAMIGLAASWCTLTSRAQVTEVGTLP